MTCFVEFHGAGFWCREDVLREWVAELLAAGKRYPDPPAWLPAALSYWDAIRSAAKYGRASLRLEVNVTSAEQQKECERFFAFVAGRLEKTIVQRANALATSLVRGELAGLAPTVLEYWSDEEWLGK